MKSFSLAIHSVLILSLAAGPVWPSALASAATAAEGDSPKEADANAPDGESDASASAVIAPGYLLRLACREDPKINGEFRVGLDGRIRLPYDVSLPAAGRTVRAFENRLKKTYQPYFRNVPKISVSIKERKYAVKISGLVKNPGTYLLRTHATLDEALAMADVKTEDLPNGYVRIEHGKKSRWVSLEDYLKGGAAHDLPAWRGGEQILFQLEKPETEIGADETSDEDPAAPSNRKIQVLGEVKNPGGVSFQHRANGYYYLIQRGGPTRDSDLDRVELLRKDPKTGQPEQVSVGSIQDITELHEADVLLIHPDRPSKFDRTLQNTGIVASILTSIVLTVFVARNNK